MDCKEVRSKMHLYMDEQLSSEEMEPFVRHINSCPDCYEELEINYIMLEGMRRLEEGGPIAVDFQAEFKNRLRRQLSHCVRQRRSRAYLYFLSLIICFVGILLGSFEHEYHTELIDEQRLQERGAAYYYESTKAYMFEAVDYVPQSLKEIIYYDE